MPEVKSTTKKRQVYFVVAYDAEDGKFFIDDERAIAVFNKQDIWVDSSDPEFSEFGVDPDEGGVWVDIYEDAQTYEEAQEKLQDAIIFHNRTNDEK